MLQKQSGEYTSGTQLTNTFTNKQPIVVTKEDELDNLGMPKVSIGAIGDYVVNAYNSAKSIIL